MESRNANEMVPSESEEWQNLILPSELSPEMIMMMEGMAEQLKSKTKSLMKTVINYKELMVLYTCAMKTVKTKFEVLDSEWNANNGDAEEQSPSEMCERNSKTSYKPPYHIH